MARRFRRLLLFAYFGALAAAIDLAGAACNADQAPQDPTRLWTIDLGGDVTGACFLVDRSGTVSYFACAKGKLVALDALGRLKKDFRGAAEPVERLIPLTPIQNQAAMLGYKNWGAEIIFLDRQGRTIGKKAASDNDISWVVANNRQVLVGAFGDGGLKLLERSPASQKLDLHELWSHRGFRNCWNVALGEFGGGFVAASSESRGGLVYLSADGKRMLLKKLGDVSTIAAVPVSATSSVVVAINEVNADREEIITARPDRILFRTPAGIKKFSSRVGCRCQRIVPGHFSSRSPQFAVLRGDGSVVVYDLAGVPLSMLPSNRLRAAIELGPPAQGRDTLLACEGKSLSRLSFPQLSKEIAAERAAIKNPNVELLKISDRDTADDLWARALWLSISDTSPTTDEVASLFKAAIARAKHKAPIYISCGDLGLGPLSWLGVASGLTETMATSLGKEVASHAQEIEKNQTESDKPVDPKLAEEIYKKALINAGQQFVDQINRAGRTAADQAVALYAAAVAEEPANRTAWFRLAYFATGERRARAIAESIRLAPENAFGYYARALAECDRGDLVAARKSVQEASERPIFRIEESPLPAHVRMRYPDHEWLRDLGVVGRPIPERAFAYFIGLQTAVFTGFNPFSRNDLPRRLRSVADKLSSEADRLEKLGKTREEVVWCETVVGMGLQTLRFEPRNVMMCLVGMPMASEACEKLERADKALNDKQGLQRAAETRKRLKRWIDEYTAARWPAGSKGKDDDTVMMREAAEGSRDFVREERVLLERTLQHAGLIDPPGQQPR